MVITFAHAYPRKRYWPNTGPQRLIPEIQMNPTPLLYLLTRLALPALGRR